MIRLHLGARAGAGAGSPPLPLQILCLGAHSDDIEIGCGGSILRLLAEYPGSSVHWVVLSAPGVREQEARSSAADFLTAAANSSLSVRAFPESYFPQVWAEIKGFLEGIRRLVQPDLIFCHHRHDRHQDHRLVAELVWNTFRDHLVLEYEIPKYEGDLGTPNFFLPLPRALADRKVELLLHHFGSQGQRDWFRSETFHGLMSIRGIECRAPDGRAEAFHAYKLSL